MDATIGHLRKEKLRSSHDRKVSTPKLHVQKVTVKEIYKEQLDNQGT